MSLDRVTSRPASFTKRLFRSGEALRFQWLRDHVEIPGATLASYTTPTLALADSGAVFSVIVYSGRTTSAA